MSSHAHRISAEKYVEPTPLDAANVGRHIFQLSINEVTTSYVLNCLVVSCNKGIEYERYDGWFNNLANPSWGTVGKFVEALLS